MKCPYCGFPESKVITSRPADDGSAIRRRRECLGCGKRFSTCESLDRIPLIVIKRDGSRQAFDRNKLVNGMVRACEKRPVSLREIENIADEVEQKLFNRMENEIPTSSIGEMVMLHMKDVDEVSYVRFASVYRSFKDLNSFMEELTKLLSDKQSSRNTN